MEIFIRFLGHDDASRITWEDVTAWRDHLVQEPGRHGRLRKPVTVRDKYLTALNCTLGWGVEERRLDANVAREVVVRIFPHRLEEQRRASLVGAPLERAVALPITKNRPYSIVATMALRQENMTIIKFEAAPVQWLVPWDRPWEVPF